MFRKKQKFDFDDYISELSRVFNNYKKALDRDDIAYMAPEREIEILDEEDKVIEVASIESTKSAIKNHNVRIHALEKMAKGKNISQEEHDLLLEMSVFSEDNRIANYPYVNNSDKMRCSIC